MSSIYKKGRDGYFYYQAYIFNPKSNRKDKRVFHSLGTKDRDIAEVKKKKLDNRYENANNISKRKRRIILLVFSLITIFYMYTFIKRKNNNNINNMYKKLEIKSDEDISKIHPQLSLTSDPLNEDKNQNFVPNFKTEINIKLPDFSIERVERLAGAFEQGEIYVTVNKMTDKESLLILCRHLTDVFSEFKNVVICVYKNNSLGKNFAQGKLEILRIKEQKSVWMAFYTFNKVEGEYFDDDPSIYLGKNSQ